MTDRKTLFEVTREHLDTGMRGIPVGTCKTSSVDPETGVHYVGIPVGELVHLEPEEVLFLLLEKRLPNNEESRKLKQELVSHSKVPTILHTVLREIAGHVHPMKALSVAIELAIQDDEKKDTRSQVLAINARAPWILASIIRIRSGQDVAETEFIEDGIVESFVKALNPNENLSRSIMTRILKTFYILHLDHGGGNLSTFTGKAVSSGKADVSASLSASMNALSGPLHGRANQSCLEFVQRVGTDDPKEVEKFVRSEIAAGRPIYGFGHAVLRKEDPRATIQISVGQELCPEHPLFKTVCTLREVASKILAENPKIKNPNPNVDLVSGTLLQAAGLIDVETYTGFFGWARLGGIGAQILDERNARNGKGVPIYRPKFIHTSVSNQSS